MWTQKGKEHQYKRREEQSYRGAGVLELLLMDGLASTAKPAHAVFLVGTTIKPLTCAQGHTFQAHFL